MGYDACNIMSQAPLGAFLSKLGIWLGDKIEDTPYDQAWIGTLPSGWSVLFSPDAGYAEQAAKELKALSTRSEVLALTVVESVGASEAVAFKGGEIAWRTEWNPEKQVGKPWVVEGDLPAYANVRVDAAVDSIGSDDADLFNVPIDICERGSGYRYDATLEAGEFRDLRVVHIPAPTLPKHGLRVVAASLFQRHTLAFLLVVFIAFTLVVAAFSILAGAILGGILDGLLGDWGDTCLLNCAQD